MNLADVENHSTATDEGIEDEEFEEEFEIEAVNPRSASIEAEPIQNVPTQSSQPVTELLSQPTSSGLESKIDGLVGVMTQFIQMQMAQIQSSAVQSVPVAPPSISLPAKPSLAKTTPVQQTPVPPATKHGDSEELPKRRYKTGADQATINAAVDEIITHNDAQALHDLKWAITTNTLNAFSKNQRIIERILGKGKDNPDIDRIVGEREAEIDAHHQQHQIQPGHNNRHKRKRKIGDVIQIRS